MDVWITAGGQSRRFGTNKALATFVTETVLEAVIRAAGGISERLFIICSPGETALYEGFGLPVFRDLFPGKGPLGGLQTALYHARSRRLFYLACDMPLVNPEFMKWMAGIRTRALAVVPEGPRGMEPLHAIYDKALLPLVERRLGESRLSMKALVEGVPHHVVPRERVAGFCPGLMCLRSANTPEELEELKAYAMRSKRLG